MFSKMKLGTKIALGFGLLIVMAVILGGLAVYNMTNVGTQSHMLAMEYAPEVQMANEVERSSLMTMYAMRGYATTEEAGYLTEGLKYLENVKKNLDEIKALADRSPNLVKLKQEVPIAIKGVAEYEKLAQETVTINGALSKLRDKMDVAAATYMQECAAFLTSQNKAMETDIVDGAGYDRLMERLLKINVVNDIIDLGNAARIGNFKSQATRDPELLETTIAKFVSVNKKFETLSTVTRSENNIKQIENTKRAAEQYEGAMSEFLKNWLAREDLNKRRTNVADTVLETAKATSEAGIGHTIDIANQADSSLTTSKNVMLVGLIAVLIVGTLLAFFITRGITRAISRVVEGLREGAEQVASASGQVSSASQSLAEGSSEQAASIEETSSSLEEMSSMTKQNADNANQANNLMKEANQVVTSANSSMGELTTSMAEISKASEETSKIIKTIDEIAFQTNLLALNAAVEAARAGEAGAGFAVVADEVRNLAMRAADAAKNTASLIEGTVKKVNEGGELVSKTNEAFSEVAKSSAKVGELVGEIAAASSEQAQGIGQVNTAVNQMDKVVQQNAANAEESASAAEEMNAQAEQMNAYVLELVALIGGATSQNQKPVMQPKKHIHNHNNAINTHGKTGNNGHRKNSAKTPAAHMIASYKKGESPEHIIPLDDDFKDF